MTGRERWKRAQAVLLDALEQPAEDRDAFVAAACAGEEDLAEEVRALLAAHESDSLLADLGDRDDAPRLYGLETDHIGPYRILRPLGQGGMGTVFLAARQEHGVTQTVALKLLRLDFAVPKLVERFSAERRILARLEHPGIARFIDAGATPAGQPYFAMEFVEGTDLVEYCRRRRCTVADRLRLFLDVCDAVQYAHQQLVVHRDLKPGNILVTEEARAKLLDFGIAKLLDTEEPAPGSTRTGAWFTPDYASPEQVRGQPVTTLSDVYALGVVLYELLAGARPFDLRRRSPAAVEYIVTTELPERPSARVQDARVARLLRGDLDTIVLTALAKEPGRRYASVRELADDLRRHLAREPVRARPDRWTYRTAKFVQRHRVAVAAAAVALVSLIGALGAVSWQAAVAARERDRAELALEQSQQVSGFLAELFQAADPTRTAGDTAAARAILRRGVAEVERLADQPLIQARMLDALGMVFVNLGEYDRAWEFVSRGLALRREHLHPTDPDLAESVRHSGRVLRSLSRYHEAEDAYRTTLDLLRQTGRERTAAGAQVLKDLGFLMPYLGRPDESLRYYREHLALARELYGEDHPAVAEGVLLVGLSLRRRGTYDEAVRTIRDAVARHRRVLGPDDPETGRALFHLGDILVDAGRDTAEAERLYREGIAIRRAAAGPLDIGAIHGVEALARLLSLRGEHAEAEALLRNGLAVRQQVLGPDSPGVAGSLDVLASELFRQGRHAEALALKRRGHATWERAVGTEHAAVASSMSSMAEMLIEIGDYATGDSILREAITLRVRLHGPDHALVGLLYSNLGASLMRQGRYTEAETELLRGLEIQRAQQHDEHRDVRTTYGRLADLYDAVGRPADAARYRALVGG